jgi:Zn-dependent peptidase ImmA (M78 family)
LDVIKPYKFISKKQLETIATELRQKVESSRTRRLSAESIAETIADSLELNIMWSSIPADQTGEIAAMIFPTRQMIIINSNVSQFESNGFRQSTIAHEIGHWVLHINQQAVEKYIDRDDSITEIVKQPQPFLCRSIQSAQASKIEWQAQYFAGCLLMPEYKLHEARRNRDLTKWGHLYAMRDELGVTISNLKVRLKDLDWIKITNGTKQIYPGINMPK